MGSSSLPAGRMHVSARVCMEMQPHEHPQGGSGSHQTLSQGGSLVRSRCLLTQVPRLQKQGRLRSKQARRLLKSKRPGSAPRHQSSRSRLQWQLLPQYLKVGRGTKACNMNVSVPVFLLVTAVAAHACQRRAVTCLHAYHEEDVWLTALSPLVEDCDCCLHYRDTDP